MDTLFRNMPVILVFLTMAAAAWLRGGTRTEFLVPTIPWLLALLFEVMLFFPQRHLGESSVSARQRTWRHLGRDPLLYVTVVFLLVMVVPFMNRGLCLVCDYPAIMAGASPDPRIPFAPFCVDAAGHFNVLLWFVPALTAMLAAKHALSRSGKRMLVEMIVWNAAVLAVEGFIQQAAGAPSSLWTGKEPAVEEFFASFGYANMGGAFFVMAFALSVGVWLTRVAEVAAMPPIDPTRSVSQQKLHRWIRAHYPLAAALLNLFAVLSTLCRAAMINLVVLAAFAFIYYECLLVFAHRNRARNVKRAAFGFAAGIVVAISLFIFGPKDWTRELDSVSSLEVLDRVSGKGAYHARVSMAIFKDHPLFGVGGWGYRHFCRSYMTPDELEQMQTVGGANVHNDYLQFLCEHGLVGFGLLVAVFLLLVSPIFHDWFILYRAARFMRTDASPPSPRVLYCLPPGMLWTLLASLSLLFCASGDCPMRSLAVLSHLFVPLACAEGYLPKPKEDGP